MSNGPRLRNYVRQSAFASKAIFTGKSLLQIYNTKAPLLASTDLADLTTFEAYALIAAVRYAGIVEETANTPI